MKLGRRGRQRKAGDSSQSDAYEKPGSATFFYIGNGSAFGQCLCVIITFSVLCLTHYSRPSCRVACIAGAAFRRGGHARAPDAVEPRVGLAHACGPPLGAAAAVGGGDGGAAMRRAHGARDAGAEAPATGTRGLAIRGVGLSGRGIRGASD
eukprot:1018578-Pleurochrysis_carterae.AAC.8